MDNLNKKLLREALSLPINLRTALIDNLIESLNVPLQKKTDQMWTEESEK